MHMFTANSNAWAIAGMTRVLATILKWEPRSGDAVEPTYLEIRSQVEDKLIHLLKSMLHCLIAQSRDTKTGLLKNYQDGDGSLAAEWAYGDAAGTALVTSAVYRLAVILPTHFNLPLYLDWADQNYKTVTNYIDTSGKVTPVARVQGIPSKFPAEQTNEGQSMVILMYAARRDCVEATICSKRPDSLLRHMLESRLWLPHGCLRSAML
jgi:hypothetical protein